MEEFWIFIALFIIAYFSQDRSEEAADKGQLDIDISFHGLGNKNKKR